MTVRHSELKRASKNVGLKGRRHCKTSQTTWDVSYQRLGETDDSVLGEAPAVRTVLRVSLSAHRFDLTWRMCHNSPASYDCAIGGPTTFVAI